jgi:hypothetical protein
MKTLSFIFIMSYVFVARKSCGYEPPKANVKESSNWFLLAEQCLGLNSLLVKQKKPENLKIYGLFETLFCKRLAIPPSL